MGPFNRNLDLLELHMHAQYQDFPEESEDQLIAEVASWIVDKGLGALAIFILEAQKPLRNIGYHALIAMYPVLTLIGIRPASQFVCFILSSPERVEALASTLEHLMGPQAYKSAKEQRNGS